MFVSDPDTLSQGFLIRILPDLKKVPDTVPDPTLNCKYFLFLHTNDLSWLLKHPYSSWTIFIRVPVQFRIRIHNSDTGYRYLLQEQVAPQT
jgi:hypothetical protein